MTPPQAEIVKVMQILGKTYPTLPILEVHGKNPFQLLIAVILSQRARDAVTVPTASKLFARISSPQELVALPLPELEAILKPLGFQHAKAQAIKAATQTLLTDFHGKVPATEAELLSLPHVGPKTANILLTYFFHTPRIAVDTHVHRITNRLGWVNTSNVKQTEEMLSKLIPKEYHASVNRVFVAHGQQVCLPRIPHCSTCPIREYCQRVGVSTFV